jgi:uncharacterized membrane protein
MTRNMGTFDRALRAFVVAPVAIVVAFVLGANTLGGIILFVAAGSMGGGSSPPSDAPGATESPVDILERRFAEGEISLEEYRMRREALGDGTPNESGDRDESSLMASQAGERNQ